jgi:hypothetical protein
MVGCVARRIAKLAARTTNSSVHMPKPLHRVGLHRFIASSASGGRVSGMRLEIRSLCAACRRLRMANTYWSVCSKFSVGRAEVDLRMPLAK